LSKSNSNFYLQIAINIADDNMQMYMVTKLRYQPDSTVVMTPVVMTIANSFASLNKSKHFLLIFTQ